MRIRGEEDVYSVNLEIYLVPTLIDGSERAKTRDETYLSLSEIFSNIERAINYLAAKRKEDAKWTGVLAGTLVWFFGVFGLMVVNLFTDNYAPMKNAFPGLSFDVVAN